MNPTYYHPTSTLEYLLQQQSGRPGKYRVEVSIILATVAPT
jgi:hypothetical protein